MKQKIFNIIEGYCQTRKDLGKYPFVISMTTLYIELKNNGINISSSVPVINELLNEKKIFEYPAVNDTMYYTEKFKL